MYKGHKFFYLSIICVLLSIFLSVHNPVIKSLFGSINAIILFTGLVNAILLVISIVLIDKAIKHPEQSSEGVYRWTKVWPWVILVVIIYHLLSGLFLFGII
ncbi:hypothetical protein [Macrococcus equipercicus]|uniref:Uncharacterized protein n=1 Tax=Macrococcus equipercicus TaxID=69967 RepID=A0A9Q9F0V7_9STAP|nr:hypothetical protein [Macrococcus equipercicus]KAA1039080.1 hypothetical protein ERX35_007650 [Macrococcus equipercicus]UTH13257.1 hypothetical protein KFV11_08280 [Macrococcus equipercicus]